MQPPRNPVLEMAQRDPRAAMMLQQQMQGQQDRQWKLQEQQLSNGVKVAEYVSRMLQSVTNQETLDQAREQIRLVHPQAASQVPQMYSKEAITGLQQRGATITEMAQNRYHEAKARNLDMETQMFPELAKRFGLGGDVEVPASGAASQTGQQPAAAGAVPGLDKLSQPFRTKADSIADRLGANRDDFYRVMHFETGGEMSPATTNRAGSGATGLIQFMPETAKRLGTTTAALAKMTPEQQLDYVERYLEPYKGKIGTLKDLYMAVLYPTAIGKSEDSVLFSPDKMPSAYRQNAGLDAGNKGYVTVGDAVAAVERSTGGGARPTGGTTGTAQATATDPRIAQLETKIAQRTRDAQIASLMKNESLSTRLNDDANRLTAEKNRLQERSTEIPRAVERETALQPLKIAQQEAGARIQNEAKMNEPIGLDASRKMNLPPGTKWKDVPKDVRVLEDPSPTQVKGFGDLNAAAKGVKRMQGYMQNPEVRKMVGTLLTAPEAAFNRLVGDWISTLSPEQRKFAATVAREIAGLRHDMIGAGQSGIEMASLQPFLPTPSDVDPDTLSAKLEALYEGILDKHDAHRENLDMMNIRTPRAMERPAAGQKTAPGANLDKFKKLPGVSP